MMRSRKQASKASDDEETAYGKSSDRRKLDRGGQDIVSNGALIIVLALVFVVGFYLEGSSRVGKRSASTGGNNMGGPGGVGVSLIPPEEDLALVKDTDGQVYHVIFSTDCGTYQHWQSYMTFYRAMKVKQPGYVTRIASGCTPEERTVIEDWFDNNIRHMSDRFRLLLTPHFSQVKDENGNVIGDYKFFNKPHGLKFWLEHSDLLDYDNGDFPTSKDDIVILIDPDMSMLRPITKDFTSDEDVVIAEKRKDHIVARTVAHGKPFAQTYGFGAQFLKLDMEEIGGPNSPLLKATDEEGKLYFPAGPPYIATVTDSYEIAKAWSEFVPKVHKQYPHLLAEMFAYSLAAIHTGLKFQLIDSLMVSNPTAGEEGWPLVDKIPVEDVCSIAREEEHQNYALPQVVHLCQRYALGREWFFGKRKIPHDVFECPNTLYEEPPDNVGTMYDFKQPPNAKEKTDLKPHLVKREAFMVCHLTRTLNEAAEYYKRSACKGGTKANLSRSMKIADLFK